MSAEFFQTHMGRKFYEGDVPRIASALERIADAMEARNKLMEKGLVIREKEANPLVAVVAGDEGKSEKTKLSRWRRINGNGITDEQFNALFNMLMNKMSRMIGEIEDQGHPNEIVDRMFSEWAKTNGMDTQGMPYQALVSAIVNIVADEIEAAEQI